MQTQPNTVALEGDLKTPNSKLQSSVTIEGSTITARFGDIFATSDNHHQPCILLIPHYKDGILFKIMVKKNVQYNRNFIVYTAPDSTMISNATANAAEVKRAQLQIQQKVNPVQGVMCVKMDIPSIPYAILFSYEERVSEQWNEVFLEAFYLLPDSNFTVRIPTIGANNQMGFYDSAVAIYQGLCKVLRNPDVPKPKNIEVISPFSSEPIHPSKVILHIIQLMRLDQNSANDGASNLLPQPQP